MSNVALDILGVAAFALVMTCIEFAAMRVRNDRRRQARLSIAFDRARSWDTGAASFR